MTTGLSIKTLAEALVKSELRYDRAFRRLSPERQTCAGAMSAWLAKLASLNAKTNKIRAALAAKSERMEALEKRDPLNRALFFAAVDVVSKLVATSPLWSDPTEYDASEITQEDYRALLNAVIDLRIWMDVQGQGIEQWIEQ